LRKVQAGVFAAILSIALTSQATGASKVFRSSEFLTWKQTSQDFYIEASVGMASLIASQIDKAQARCIDNWYFKNEAAANASIRNVMKNNPSYHPRGIILGVVQKQCGSFKKATR